MQRGQPIWDKVFLIAFVLAWCGWLVLMALDAQRWRTSHMPVLLNVLGGVLVIADWPRSWSSAKTRLRRQWSACRRNAPIV